MNKKRNERNARLMTAIVLIGVLVTVLPIAKAGPIFNFKSILNVTWGNETQEPLIPRGELRLVTLTVTHTVTKTAWGDGVLSALTGALIPIHLQITDKPSWCTATIQSGTLSVTVQPNTTTTVRTQVSIQVTNDAPAYSLGYITIRATADRTSIIEGYENDFTLSFIPAYKSLINPSLPQTNVKELGPMDTGTIPIEITNMGNARTTVMLEVTNVPKDWVAIVTSHVLLDEGIGSTATAYLTVIPPKSFGYHNDEQTIEVSLQPVYADDYSKRGEITYQTFLVQSRGFSAPGFEAVIFLAAFALAILMVAIIRRRNNK
jgi:hypothetical protein